MLRAAVIGDPVAHSLSPAIHNAAFAATGIDGRFEAWRVPAGEAERALGRARAEGLAGLSVTMPHKAAVVPLLDEVSEDAGALDAVNCIAREGERLIGLTTDGDGFLDALTAAGVEVAGSRVLVLGAGGAGRAVIRSVGLAGAAELGVVNRSVERRSRAVVLGGPHARPADPEEAPAFDIVVNATSVGMGSDETPLEPGLLRKEHVVVDLVYEPVETVLLAAARRAGAKAIDGVGMLVHQAARAFTRWTGVEAPVDAMTRTARVELVAKT
jgi:shikimate dehydrogenase